MPQVADALEAMGLFPAFDGESWARWRVFLKALAALPLSDAELATFRACTGRQDAPTAPAREAWLIVGRRGGKSIVTAFLAVARACFVDYSATLAPGERATVMVLAADRKQARVVLRYIKGLLHSLPALEGLIDVERQESIELTNGVVVEVSTASFKTTRGYSAACVIADEVAFWASDDSANPDSEILAALRPAMATVPGALLLGISTPYGRSGELWRAYDRHFGKDGDVLVWKADTRTMNPLVDEAIIAEAYASDPASAAAEYGAEFRRDIERFLDPDAIAGVTVRGRRELPPVPEVVYVAFVDPSGGSGDSMTLAIGHREQDGVVVLDVLRERKPPFAPDQVVREFVDLCTKYAIRKVVGDRYGGVWVSDAFKSQDMDYIDSPMAKSDLYQAFLPMVNSGQVALLDHERLRVQLEGLERRTARGGKDSIDHAPRGHDDVANVVAGVCTCAALYPRQKVPTLAGVRLGIPGTEFPAGHFDGGTVEPWPEERGCLAPPGSNCPCGRH